MIHNSISFVFFGTDDFSAIILDELKKAGLLPSLIITQPDRPKGRGLLLAPPPVKLWAQENSIKFLQPDALDFSVNYQLKAISYQLFVVASYGLIIPEHILDIPEHGTLNVHPSLLPKYRGATPIESQILNGEKEVGVTIMQMDERMDHGPILAQRRWESIRHSVQNPNAAQNANIQIPNGAELRKKLAKEGGRLLAEVMPKWVAGEIEAIPQDHTKATYTEKLTKADGEIKLTDDPYQNFLRIQAFAGGSGTYFFVPASYSPLSKRALRLGGGGGLLQPPKAAPFVKRGRIRVVIKSADFRDGKLIIIRVVPEGRKETSYEEFLRGLRQ